MDNNLLHELDVEKLARALPDGQAREIAIQKAAELLYWAERAIADANAVLDEHGPVNGDSDNGVEVFRSSGGGSGSGGGKGGRK